MKHEITPQESNREKAYNLWMKSPMPMVTLTKTFDITRLQRISKRRNLKLNMLLCWCIGKAASQIKEFYTLPEGDKLFRYDDLAINVIVNNDKGGISSCDVPYTDNLEQFNASYMALTQKEHMRKCLCRRKNGCGNLCHDCHRIRLYCQPIHR